MDELNRCNNTIYIYIYTIIYINRINSEAVGVFEIIFFLEISPVDKPELMNVCLSM